MNITEFLADAKGSDITLPVQHLSVSQAQMLARCPEQYRQRYVLGKKERPGAALIVGSALHESIEHDFLWKMNYGELLRETEMKAVYHAAFDKKMEDAGGVGEIAWDTRSNPDTVRLHGEEATLLYHERVAPKMVPERVEHKFELHLPDVPVPVHGLVDFIGTRQDETAKVAVDYKTTARAQRTLKPEWILQGRTYSAATHLPVEWHVVVKGSKPNVITSQDAPELFQFEQAGNREFVARYFQQAAKLASYYLQTYGSDESWPTIGLTHPFACSYCAWKPNCTAWKLT